MSKKNSSKLAVEIEDGKLNNKPPASSKKENVKNEQKKLKPTSDSKSNMNLNLLFDDKSSVSSTSTINMNLLYGETNVESADVQDKMTIDVGKHLAKDVAKDTAEDIAPEIAKEVTSSVIKSAVKKAVKEERNAEKTEQNSNDRIDTMTAGDTPLVPDNAIAVLIVDRYNGFNKTQAEQLKAKLIEYIDKLLLKNGSFYPTFYATSYEGKKLKIHCGDKFSVTWLKRFIANLRPLWEGARLEVMSMPGKEQSNLKVQPLEKPQIIFYIPDGKQRVHFSDIIKHFEKRNQPLKVDSWQTTRIEPGQNGVTHVAYIDNESLDVLKKKGGYLFYQLTTVQIQRIRKS